MAQPFVPEDMEPRWPTKEKATCEHSLLLCGELKVKCELAAEGRHAGGFLSNARLTEHHGHLEMPGKIWVTVSWREVGR